ncbi:helix-turn-helix domain-containing protein [Demequina sp. SO4-13]|uniref:helix-turn-helix domain-containing protein n=1 Tax=Demequina sp. SO4-13 TaxID=3401027 RepID=UPI003AF95BC5
MPTAGGAAQADSRRRVVDALREHRGAAPLAEVAAAVGLHANTVREHLDALVEDGSAETWHERSGARGRPRSLYRLTPAGTLTADVGEDALRLAGIVLEAFGQDESRARAATLAAGARWGEEFAAALAGIDAPIDRVVTALGAAGAEPSIQSRVEDGLGCVHVARCPFRALASVRPDVVCGIHAAAIEQIAVGPRSDGVKALVRRASGREGGACVVELERADAGIPAPASAALETGRRRESGAGPEGPTPLSKSG